MFIRKYFVKVIRIFENFKGGVHGANILRLLAQDFGLRPAGPVSDNFVGRGENGAFFCCKAF
jgi:hypothetical protein